MNAAQPLSPGRNLAYIDALRGIAILMVIVTHVAPISSDIHPLLASLSAYGRMGVQLFFVASAVTLCMSMSHRRNESQPLIGFFLRRFFRIAPAYYLGILVYAVILSLISEKSVPFIGIALHAAFLHGFSLDYFMEIVPGGWSIGVEFMFYFMFPWLYRFAFTAPSLRRWLLIIGLSFLIAQFTRILLQSQFGIEEDPWQISYWNFANQSIVFIIGMITFQILQSNAHQRLPLWQPIGAFLLLTAVSLVLYRVKPILHTYWIVSASGLSFGFLTLLFSRLPFLSPGWLQRIGKTSFSMYLIHFLVIRLYQHTPIYTHFMPEAHFKFIINLIFVVSITYLLSRVSFRLIEQPGMNIGKSLAAQFRTGSSA